MRGLTWMGMVLVALGVLVASAPTRVDAQAVRGTCASCGSDTGDPNCGACMTNGDACFSALPAASLIAGPFRTSDGRAGTDPSLHFAQLVGGMAASASDYMHAVNTGYGGRGGGFYGNGTPTGYCGSSGGPAPAYTDPTMYHFGWNTTPEDTFNHLDCWNGEIDRYYLGEAGHPDGGRVCDGEQAQFDPSMGAIFDLGGEGNRVVIFPYTDHPPLPCESFEYTVWLSDDPHATMVTDAAHPDPTKWNPAQIVRAFLQGWIPDMDLPGAPMSADPRHPNLGNATQRDGFAQVFALPCGLTFRYASVVAGNIGTPSSSCVFYSFDSELDAALGLNEDDTPLCPDADGDGYRDIACGGTDCNDHDPSIHPGAYEDCSFTHSVDCTGTVPQCPATTSCYRGFCAPGCIEGACASGFSCVTGDAGVTYCLPTACVNVTCPVGQLCGPMGCQDPCEGAVCPLGLFCHNGTCQDPCQGYLCPAHQHCQPDSTHSPHCVADCTCLPCTGGATCDTSTSTLTAGRCLAAGCDSIRCVPPSVPYCAGAMATCTVACDGVVCPLGQVCNPATGACARDLCFGVACQSSYVCQAGMCVPMARSDAGLSTMDGGFQSTDGGTDAGVTPLLDGGMDGGGLLINAPPSGCGCAVPDASGNPGTGAAMLAAGFVVGSLRRRSRRLLPCADEPRQAS